MNEFTAALGIVGVERLDEIVAWKNAAAREQLDPLHPDRVCSSRTGWSPGFYKYIVFDPLEVRPGRSTTSPATASWATPSTSRTPTGSRENHWCAPLYYRPGRASRSRRSPDEGRSSPAAPASSARTSSTSSPRTATRRSSSTSCPRRTTCQGAFETVIGDITDADGRRRGAARLRRGRPPRRGRRRERRRRTTRCGPTRVNVARHVQTLLEAARAKASARVVYGEHGLGLRQRARARAASTRRRRSPLPTISTPRRSSPARCTAAPTSSSTASSSTILRFGIPYGPRARPAAVVPAFVGDGAARGDAADDRRRRAARRASSSTSRTSPKASSPRSRPAARAAIYNLVGDEETSVRQIADAVREVVADVPIVHVAGAAGGRPPRPDLRRAGRPRARLDGRHALRRGRAPLR